VNFECNDCGMFVPEKVFYTCPAQAACPVCGKMVVEIGGGINIVSEVVWNSIKGLPRQTDKE